MVDFVCIGECSQMAYKQLCSYNNLESWESFAICKLLSWLYIPKLTRFPLPLPSDGFNDPIV